MVSHAPSKCCIHGVKHDGEAEGSIGTFNSYKAYFARPKVVYPKAGIVLIPDFMGYELINTKLLADQFAANGYLTMIPDVWEGDNVPLNFENGGDFDLGKWVAKHGPEKVEPIVEAAIHSLHNDHGVRSIAGVGYCLGAKYVCRFMAQGKGFNAGYFAHPSLVTDDEIKGVAGPLSIAAAETDELFPAPKRHETEEILRTNKTHYQLSLYSDVEHGFALKADLSVPANRIACETAFIQAVNWFNSYLGQAGPYALYKDFKSSCCGSKM